MKRKEKYSAPLIITQNLSKSDILMFSGEKFNVEIDFSTNTATINADSSVGDGVIITFI